MSGIIEERPSLQSYGDWLNNMHGVKLDVQRANYDVVAAIVEREVTSSKFWTDLLALLAEANDEYKIQKGDDLLDSYTVPLHRKNFDSFLNKTYRKNVLQNNLFPAPPNGGWILPPAWYSSVNDIVRTTISVRYLDGVEFLSDRLVELCKNASLSTSLDFEARSEGYYAAHLYFTPTIRVPDIDWTQIERQFHVEVQITTHVKEAIKAILHPIYERARIRAVATNEKDWRWDLTSDEFVASNLGHIIHYVEGMIVRIRDEQRGK